MATILIIDDEESIRHLLREVLEKAGHKVLEAANGREGLEQFRAKPMDLVITDLEMPEMNGVELLRALAARDYAGRTIILSGHQNDPLLADAWALGPQEVLDKPLDLERALMAIQLVMVCREC